MKTKENISRILKIILPQKTDSRIVEYGGFVFFLLYGVYELGKSFQKNEEVLSAIKLDMFAIVFAILMAYLAVFASLALFNFVHWLFVRKFDQEKMAVQKFAFSVPENWMFIGVMQILLSVGMWVGFVIPTLIFEGQGFAGVLGADKFTLLYKFYFVSLFLVGILQLVGLVLLLKVKKAGLYWLGAALFICLLGAVPRAVNASFDGGDFLQELKPALDIILNFAIIYFSIGKVTLKTKTI